MEIASVESLERKLPAGPAPYYEFLRVPAMSAGIYSLEAGAVDPQLPHREDEVYYLVHGRARFRMGDLDRLVDAGDIIFVPAEREHRFHSITQRLLALVIFAPAERPTN